VSSLVGRTRAGLRAFGFGAWMIAVVEGHKRLVVPLKGPQADTLTGRRRAIHLWSQGTFPLLGVTLHRVAGAPPRGGGPYLVVGNHRSPLDILLAIHAFGGAILAHDGVARLPAVGAGARAVGTVFVDRDDPKSGARAIREIRRRLKDGHNVIAFPEGSTFEGDAVRPFKAGVFAAARGVPGVEVLPFGAAYEPGAEYVDESFRQHMFRMAARPKTPVWMSIGAPVPVPRGEGPIEDLRRAVQGLVDRAAAARDGRPHEAP
jgi:1-acyl-sn-glycerol-3-phosphate acyltransferase